jgi:hypothetical protein
MVKLADLIYVRQIKVQYKHSLCYLHIYESTSYIYGKL